MNRIGPGASDVLRDSNFVHARPLVVPPVVRKWLLRKFLAKGLHAMPSSQHMHHNQLVEHVSAVYTAATELLPVQISAALPRCNGFPPSMVLLMCECFRTVGGVPPVLRDGVRDPYDTGRPRNEPQLTELGIALTGI